jgi:ATP-dependent helicase/DNAse subunit B
MLGGGFRLLAAEMKFGGRENTGLKPLYIYEGGGRKIELLGSVDRVDTYGDFVRVVDYKTGGIKRDGFDFSAMYYGKNLQLAMYMTVLEINGYRPAGMFYFPFAVAFSDGEFSHRLAGVYNGGADILTAFDRALLEPGASSRIISARRKASADAVLSGDSFYKSNYAFTERQLTQLSGYAYEAVKGAAAEILSGCIKISPTKGACAFCAYGAVCGGTDCERVQPAVKPDYIFDALCGSLGEGAVNE